MAATDLNDLNNFEYHWETAAVTFLNADLGIPVVRTVTEDSLVLPRIEIQFMVEDAFEPFAPHNGGGSSSTQDFRAFNAIFQARIITDNSTGGAADHATYRAKVRTALMRSGANWYGGGPGGTLAGTGSITSGTTNLTGTGSAFTTQLEVSNHFTVDSQEFVVASISSDSALTVTTAAGASYSGTLALSASNVPYYDLKEIRPSSTEYDAEGDVNVTQLNYSVVWEIRDDAWPA